jgi:hypothetical protein
MPSARSILLRTTQIRADITHNSRRNVLHNGMTGVRILLQMQLVKASIRILGVLIPILRPKDGHNTLHILPRTTTR